MQSVTRPSAARRQLADVPGPRGWPIVGNAFQIDRERMHLAVEAWTRRYGSCFRFRIGERRFLAVADHEVLAALMRDRPDGVRRAANLERIWLEMGLFPGVFVAEGEAWRLQRRMVMAGFDPGHVRQYLPALLQVGQRLRGRWSRAARAGEEGRFQPSQPLAQRRRRRGGRRPRCRPRRGRARRPQRQAE